jgi:hypothetical protein
MVAPAAWIREEFWDEAERLGLVKMKALVPQILARYAGPLSVECDVAGEVREDASGVNESGS